MLLFAVIICETKNEIGLCVWYACECVCECVMVCICFVIDCQSHTYIIAVDFDYYLVFVSERWRRGERKYNNNANNKTDKEKEYSERRREKKKYRLDERKRDIPSERRDYTNVYNVALGAN